MEREAVDRNASDLQELISQVQDFSELAHLFDPEPGDLPDIPGIDIYGECLQKNGRFGGDHITYVDFKKRYKLDALRREASEQLRLKLAGNFHKAGLAVIDVEGHDLAAAFIAAVFHQAFLLGVSYELKMFGEVTTHLFENINTRFYNSSGISKTLTMIYGEIMENGTFRFLSAAHPPPKVFSQEFDRIVRISEDRLVTFPQIGTMPSKENSEKSVPQLGYKETYTVNEINLMGGGDILLIYSDGISDHRNSRGERYFPERLETKLRECKRLPARQLFACIKDDFLSFNSLLEDDATLVIIKKI